METPKVKWACSLSDGTNAYEDKNEYQIIKGELSPWNRLLLHIKENDLTITSLSLYTDENQRWNLPSVGGNPKFSAFDQAPKPLEYVFCRKMAANILDGKTKSPTIFNIIEARYEDKVLQTWVSEDSRASWSLIL